MLLIKILDFAGPDPFAIHEINGFRFIFNWSPKLKAYLYEAKNQLEADTIFGTPRNICFWTFAAVVPDEQKAPVVTIEDAAEKQRLLARIEELEAELAARPARKRKEKPEPQAPATADTLEV